MADPKKKKQGNQTNSGITNNATTGGTSSHSNISPGSSIQANTPDIANTLGQEPQQTNISEVSDILMEHHLDSLVEKDFKPVSFNDILDLHPGENSTSSSSSEKEAPPSPSNQSITGGGVESDVIFPDELVHSSGSEVSFTSNESSEGIENSLGSSINTLAGSSDSKTAQPTSEENTTSNTVIDETNIDDFFSNETKIENNTNVSSLEKDDDALQKSGIDKSFSESPDTSDATHQISETASQSNMNINSLDSKDSVGNSFIENNDPFGTTDPINPTNTPDITDVLFSEGTGPEDRDGQDEDGEIFKTKKESVEATNKEFAEDSFAGPGIENSDNNKDKNFFDPTISEKENILESFSGLGIDNSESTEKSNTLDSIPPTDSTSTAENSTKLEENNENGNNDTIKQSEQGSDPLGSLENIDILDSNTLESNELPEDLKTEKISLDGEKQENEKTSSNKESVSEVEINAQTNLPTEDSLKDYIKTNEEKDTQQIASEETKATTDELTNAQTTQSEPLSELDVDSLQVGSLSAGNEIDQQANTTAVDTTNVGMAENTQQKNTTNSETTQNTDNQPEAGSLQNDNFGFDLDALQTGDDSSVTNSVTNKEPQGDEIINGINEDGINNQDSEGYSQSPLGENLETSSSIGSLEGDLLGDIQLGTNDDESQNSGEDISTPTTGNTEENISPSGGAETEVGLDENNLTPQNETNPIENLEEQPQGSNNEGFGDLNSIDLGTLNTPAGVETNDSTLAETHTGQEQNSPDIMNQTPAGENTTLGEGQNNTPQLDSLLQPNETPLNTPPSNQPVNDIPQSTILEIDQQSNHPEQPIDTASSPNEQDKHLDALAEEITKGVDIDELMNEIQGKVEKTPEPGIEQQTIQPVQSQPTITPEKKKGLSVKKLTLLSLGVVVGIGFLYSSYMFFVGSSGGGTSQEQSQTTSGQQVPGEDQSALGTGDSSGTGTTTGSGESIDTSGDALQTTGSTNVLSGSIGTGSISPLTGSSSTLTGSSGNQNPTTSGSSSNGNNTQQLLSRPDLLKEVEELEKGTKALIMRATIKQLGDVRVAGFDFQIQLKEYRETLENQFDITSLETLNQTLTQYKQRLLVLQTRLNETSE